MGSRRHTRNRTYDFCSRSDFLPRVRLPAGGITERMQRQGCAVLCLPHLPAIHQSQRLHLPLRQGGDGDRGGACQGAGGLPALLASEELLTVAKDAVERAGKQICFPQRFPPRKSKIDTLTANLDRMYMDRLEGLLTEEDFQRIYDRAKLERTLLEENGRSSP